MLLLTNIKININNYEFFLFGTMQTKTRHLPVEILYGVGNVRLESCVEDNKTMVFWKMATGHCRYGI